MPPPRMPPPTDAALPNLARRAHRLTPFPSPPFPSPPRKRSASARPILEAPTHERAVATNVLMKQKRVMDLLNVTRKPMSTAELHNELGFPVDSPSSGTCSSTTTRCCTTNRRDEFSYRAKHVIADRREMLALVQKHPDGILLDDVADAYAAAGDDAQALVDAGAAISLVNAESREKVLYPVDDAYEVEVEEDVAGMFHAVEIPAHDPDFDAAVRTSGRSPRRDARRRRGLGTTTATRREGGRGKEEEEKGGQLRTHEGDERAPPGALQGAAGGTTRRVGRVSDGCARARDLPTYAYRRRVHSLADARAPPRANATSDRNLRTQPPNATSEPVHAPARSPSSTRRVRVHARPSRARG